MALVFEVTVNPQSGRQAWVVDKGGRIKCFLKSQPEKNQANNELIKVLSDKLDVPQDDIEIVTGHAQRKKVIKIHKRNFTLDDLFEALGLARQQQIV